MVNKLFDFSNLETDQEMKKILNIENDEYKNDFNRSRSIIMKNSMKEEEHNKNVEIENKSK